MRYSTILLCSCCYNLFLLSYFVFQPVEQDWNPSTPYELARVDYPTTISWNQRHHCSNKDCNLCCVSCSCFFIICCMSYIYVCEKDVERGDGALKPRTQRAGILPLEMLVVEDLVGPERWPIIITYISCPPILALAWALLANVAATRLGPDMVRKKFYVFW